MLPNQQGSTAVKRKAEGSHRKKGAAGTAGAAAPQAHAEASNRACASCNVLRTGVDSLYLSFAGELSELWSGILDGKREAAQSASELVQADAQVSILDHLFEVKPHGKGMYRYVLQDNAYHIQLASRGQKRIPVASCQIASEWATKSGLDIAVANLRNIISSFASLAGEPTVSRVDVFADFVASDGIDAPERAWVKRAAELSRYRQGDEFSGWTFGKGGIMSARLYDKTLQIKKSGQEYLKALWRDAGWNGEDRVYRLEFQFRRDMLRQLGVKTFTELLDRVGGLWAYATLDWLRLTVPNADDNTPSRWPTHPAWLELQATPWYGAEKAVRMPASKQRVPDDRVLFGAFLSVVSRYMGAKGMRGVRKAIAALSQDAQMFFDQRLEYGEGFEERAIRRAAVKAKQYNVPFPGVSDESQAIKDETDAYRRASRGD